MERNWQLVKKCVRVIGYYYLIGYGLIANYFQKQNPFNVRDDMVNPFYKVRLLFHIRIINHKEWNS